MKRIVAIMATAMLGALLIVLPAIADTLRGRIINQETGAPLQNASVEAKLIVGPGYNIINQTQTDSTGVFTVNFSNEGRVVLSVSMIGYRTAHRVDYSYGEETNDTTEMGDIALRPTALMLQEVEVTANMPRITMRGDTIVFNPEAFKLKDGARLDELIRKLPGVQNKDGQLYWNDKPIRLMMNGRNVFGGDGVLGQLPAEVAQNIKLYDRKSELSRHTGEDDDTEDNVLDIQVKPGFLDKWYGDISANAMTGKRYQGQLDASRLSKKNPQMVFANANNENSYIDRTMNMWRMGNISNFGKSQFGSYNYEYNWQTKGTAPYDNNSFDICASIAHRDGWADRHSSLETFMPDADHTYQLSLNHAYNHVLQPQLRAKLYAYTDSVNVIEVNVDASVKRQRTTNDVTQDNYTYEAGNDIAASTEALKNVSSEQYQSSNETEQRNLNITYNWTHYIGKKGDFQLDGETKLSGSNTDKNFSRTLSYTNPATPGSKLWQYSNQTGSDVSTRLAAKLSYWLGKKVLLEAAEEVSYANSHSRAEWKSDTDECLIVDGRPTTADALNDENNRLHTLSNAVTVGATIKPTKNVTIHPRAVWTLKRESIDYKYGTLDTTAVRTSSYIDPTMTLKWKINRNNSMDLSFEYTTTLPDLVSTMAYSNTLDPLQITQGNAELQSSHSHTTTYHYRRMWLRKQITMSLTAAYTHDINPITTLYTYNAATGAYTTMPVNVRGGDTYKLGLLYDQGLGVSFRFTDEANAAWNNGYGFLTRTALDQPLTLNREKNFRFENKAELSYEDDHLILSLSDNVTVRRMRYADATYNATPVDNAAKFDATVKVGQFEIGATATHYSYAGYTSSEMNSARFVCDASVAWMFCKNKCKLELSAQDIFNQDKRINNKYSAYQRQEYWSDYQHHYAQLSFTYRFDAKGDKQGSHFVF